jgi:hypothetical protein
MRSSYQSPSIVPPGNDQDVYLVLDDFSRHGNDFRMVRFLGSVSINKPVDTVMAASGLSLPRLGPPLFNQPPERFARSLVIQAELDQQCCPQRIRTSSALIREPTPFHSGCGRQPSGGS